MQGWRRAVATCHHPGGAGEEEARRTLVICALAASALWGCHEAICAVEEQFNDCHPAFDLPPDAVTGMPGCGGVWQCDSRIGPTQTYEIRCEDEGDAGVVCGCYRNGSFERETPLWFWCDPPPSHGDNWERILDANSGCEWSMSTCRV